MSRKIQLLFLLAAGFLFTACNNPTSGVAGSESNKTASEAIKDKVLIKSYDAYPTALGCETASSGIDRKDCYLLANGTSGEVVEWHQNYTTHIARPYALRDMFAESKIKITSGPLKGKMLYVSHAYINIM